MTDQTPVPGWRVDAGGHLFRPHGTRWTLWNHIVREWGISGLHGRPVLYAYSTTHRPATVADLVDQGVPVADWPPEVRPDTTADMARAITDKETR